MKRLVCVVMLVAVAGWCVSGLLAQDKPKEGDKPREVKREGELKKEEPKAARVPEAVGRIDKMVGLTDEQRQQVIDLNKARELAIQAANEAFRQQVLTLLSPEQKAKWAAAAKEGDKPKGGAKDGEKRTEGPRDGEKPKAGPGDQPK